MMNSYGRGFVTLVVTLALVAVASWYFVGCEKSKLDGIASPTDDSGMILTTPDTQETPHNPYEPGDRTVYQYMVDLSVNWRGDLTKKELDEFRQRLKHDVGIDIKKIPASEWAAHDTLDFGGLEREPTFIFGPDTIYFNPGTDDLDPGEGGPKNYWECVKECYESCIAMCDPDELYWYCCALCERQCKIRCSKNFPGGRFSRKPS